MTVRRSRLTGLLASLVLALSGCAGDGLVDGVFEPDIYIVRPGDTLYSIAWRYGLDYRQLQRWNDIENPRLLQIGQRLRLSPPDPSARAGGTPVAARATPSPEAERPPAPEPSDQAPDRAAGPQQWQWPVPGPVIGTFEDGLVVGHGIDLGGELHTIVRAAASGEVVYSGDGLQAYGRLVIIRHGEDFLSAYAHNSRLLVEAGQHVAAGEPIARMGKTDSGRVLLHFEIRREGTPVDPLNYLPARD